MKSLFEPNLVKINRYLYTEQHRGHTEVVDLLLKAGGLIVYSGPRRNQSHNSRMDNGENKTHFDSNSYKQNNIILVIL
jgi:hypothetical protein